MRAAWNWSSFASKPLLRARRIELGADHSVEAALPVLSATGFEAFFGTQPCFHFVDGDGEGWEAVAGGSDGANDGRRSLGMIGDEGLQASDFMLDAVGSFTVGFVHDEDVGDFHEAGLEALDVVTHAGDEDDESDVGEAGDLDFILADADGFDEEHVFAAGFEDESDVRGGKGESAERAAGGHGAGVEAGVAGMLAQADAVAEKGAAGEGARWVDGDKANGLVGMAEVLSEAVDEGALAGAGRAGDADAEGVAGMRETGGKQGGGFGRVIFDEGDGAGEGAGVALAEAGDELGYF